MQNLKNYEIFFHPVFWLKLKLGINMTCVWGKATGINGSWLLNVSNRFQKWNPPNLLHPLGRNFLVAWLSFQNSVLQGSCGTVSWQVGPGYQPSLSHDNCWLFRCWSSLSGWSSCGASPSTSTSTTPATPSGWWTPASWTPTDAGRGRTRGGEGRRDHYWRHNTGTVGSPPCISQTNTRVSTKLGQVEVGHCIASHNPNFGHNWKY